jgi:GNAT superfamily N-acetyltransferase
MEVGPGLAYDPVADGELVAVVTFLEMHERPTCDTPPSDLRLRRMKPPMLDEYRTLFRRIGAPWLWFSRLLRNDASLAEIIHDPQVQVFAVEDAGGSHVGLLELDFRQPGECELSFVGLVPELSGKGHGRWLLGEAVRRAWKDGVERVHVHTCSLDHPAALAAYRRAGFVPFKRAIERFPDPRLLGILPLDCAPQIPVIGTPESVSPRPAS